MSHADRLPDLDERIRQYEEAIANFARLHEELAELRENAPGETSVQVEAMLKLNAETVETIKGSLTVAKKMKRGRENRQLAAAVG
jgi:hypothetical protein